MTPSHPIPAPCQWSSLLASALDRRSAPRLVRLFLGAVLARGRRTVTTWIRAAKLSDRYQSCCVAVAAAGKKAIDPEAILMDIQMPQIDGLEAIRRLRAGPRRPGLVIVAVTALAMPGDRERCLAAGADAYLAKPISLRGLVAVLENLLNQERPTGVD